MIDTKPKYFNSPQTLPTWNYFEILESGDLRFLLILNDYTELPEIEDKTELENIYTNKILYRMPAGSFELKLQRELLELCTLECKVEIGEERTAKVFLERQKRKVNNLLKDSNGTTSHNLNDEVVNIEMILNNNIDVLTCPVAKFMSYRKQAIKKNEALRKRNG